MKEQNISNIKLWRLVNSLTKNEKRSVSIYFSNISGKKVKASGELFRILVEQFFKGEHDDDSIFEYLQSQNLIKDVM